MAPQRRHPAWRPHRPARNEPPSASPGARRAMRTVHRVRSTAPGVREEGHIAVLQDTVTTGISRTQVKAEPTITSSPKRLARIAGVLYLIVGIFGGFALAYVSPLVYIPGDATATAAKVAANADLVRVGVLADLLQATVFVFLAMTLYLLLARVQRNVATAFGIAGSNALVLLLLDIHNYGYLIAQIFFGLWLVPLGYLAYTSKMFPRALGVVLIAAGISYVLDLLVAFVSPELSRTVHTYFAILPTIAEVWMLGYLLIFGVRTARPWRT